METPIVGGERTDIETDNAEGTVQVDVTQNNGAAVNRQIQQLITLIKTSLKGDKLNPTTQRELARLLSLTPQLDHRHTQQINLLELAVSTLLEPDGETQPGETRKASKNLVFAQETRQQIVQQACPHPNLVKGIIKGEGTPYIRLISGLSWFFMSVVIAPTLFLGLMFFIWDLTTVGTFDKTIDSLATEKTVLEKENELQQQQINVLNNVKNALSAELNETRSTLGKQIEALALEPDTSKVKAELREIKQALDLEILSEGSRESEQLTALTIQRNGLDALKEDLGIEITQGRSRTSVADVGGGILGDSDTNGTPLEAQDVTTQLKAEVESETTQKVAQAEAKAKDQTIVPTLFQIIPYHLIGVVVAMGAMGSTISVIVRANTFINQAQQSDNDLFLTGFFRPLVGMSFAIFCVALLEAGIFSGFFDIANREEDPTYWYIAIAFVAGFSERLVSDVVGKTEDTFAGPSSRS